MMERRSRLVVDRPLRVASDIAIGAGAAAAGVLLRAALSPLLGTELPFLTLYPAVVLASLAGGLTSGLTAIVVGLLLGAVTFAPLSGPTTANAVGSIVFVLAGILIAWLGHAARRARHEAELERERARFLAEAARVLHDPLDRTLALKALSGVVVPDFADWCVIDLFGPDGRFTGAVIAAPDERQRTIAQEVRDAYPYRPDASAGVPWVARTGQVEAVLDPPSGFFDQIPDPELRARLRSLGYRSWISAPMTVPDGRTLGVMTLVRAASRRRFERGDVDVVADLARRTAVALDQADLLRLVRARRNELEAVIAAIPEAVVLADAEGAIEVANAAAVEALGDVVGSPFTAALDGLRPVAGHDGLVVSPTGRYLVPRVLEAEVDDQPVRFATLVDRTEVIETEAARDAFVGMLSHELRTPITTIYGAAHLLRRAPSGDRRAELAEELTHETERLLRLVDDLLVLSRFERGRLEVVLEPLMAGRVIAAAVAAEAELGSTLEVRVDAAYDLPAVLGDETYLRQIVRNVLSNAAKYAGPRAHVRIRVEASEGQVRATFEDDGPGIDPAVAERVFGLFERLPTREAQPGAGIGLFVCRRLAEVMGGSLTLEAHPGPGARFVLSLPALVPDGPRSDEAVTSAVRDVPASRLRAAERPERPDQPDQPTALRTRSAIRASVSGVSSAIA